jgi:hypothetical protein
MTNNNLPKQWLGISGFAMLHPKFPIKRFLRQFPRDFKAPATAVLLGYFGARYANLKAFCEHYKNTFHLVELHFGFRDWTSRELTEWKPAARKKFQDKVLLAKRAMQRGNEKTVFILSPILEDDVSDVAFRRILNQTKKAFPDLLVVRCPIHKDPNKVKVRADYFERHGNMVSWPVYSEGWADYDKQPASPSQFIANLDGDSIAFDNKEKYDVQITPNQGIQYRDRHSQWFCTLSWSAEQQGLGGTGNYQKPPVSQRKYIVRDAAIAFHRDKWFVGWRGGR